MAKKRNLLLTTLLAVVCLTALLVASFVVGGGESPAQAASQTVVRYVKSSFALENDETNGTKEGMLVASYNGNNYALTMYGPSSSSAYKSQYVLLDGDTVSAVNTNTNNSNAVNSLVLVDEIPNWTTWTVSIDNTNKTVSLKSNTNYGNYYFSTYSNTGLQGSTTEMKWKYLDNGNSLFTLQSTQYPSCNIALTGTNTFTAKSNTSEAISFCFYEKKDVTIENAVTVTFDRGNESASGEMNPKVLSAGSTYTLPKCGFSLTNYAFTGWKVGNAETPTAVGETITVDADITLTAVWEYNVYDITYVLDKDNPESKRTTKYVEKGKSYSLPSFTNVFTESDLPAGKLFADKWTDAEGTEYNKSSSITLSSNIELYPVFTDAVTVSFDWSDCTPPSNTTGTYACYKNVSLLPGANYTLYKYTPTASYRPTKDGYVLAGWKNKKTGEEYKADLSDTESQTITIAINEDTVFEPIWKFDGFTITFMVNDEVYATKTYAKSTSSSSQNYYFSKEGVAMPTAPEGMEFAKWTTTSKYNSNYTYSISGSTGASNYSGQYLILPGESTSSTWKITNYDVVLTATFQNLPIDVVFKFQTEDGNVYKTENKTITASNSSSSVYLTDAYAGDIPQGYAVLNWTDETGKTYVSKSNVYIYRTDSVYEKTLTVHYAKAVSVTFNGNGGTMSSSYKDPISALENSSYQLPSYASAATRDGYELIGFTCSADNQFYALKSQYQLGSEDVTFTAVWRYEGYTLIFRLEGQEDKVILVPITGGYNENTTYTIAAENPSQENANFLGWALNGDTSKLYKKGDILNTAALQALPDREGVFTAQFKMKEMVKITYHFGNETKEVEAEKGNNFRILHISSIFADWNANGDSTFKGWSKNADFTGALINESYQSHDADTHYYAVVVRTFIVTFEFGVEDGTVTRQGDTETPVQVLYNSQGNSNPTKENYTLIGWATEQGGELVYRAEAGVIINQACTLYAVWDYNYKDITIEIVGKGDKITLTGEILKDANQFTLNEVIESLSDEDKEKLSAIEHKTITWVNVTNDLRPITNYDEKITNNKDVMMVLRATFIDTLYTITITNTGSKDIVITQTYGTPVTAPVITRDGYEFDSFRDSQGQVYEFTTMPDTNITISIKWTALMGTITFDLNGGVGEIAPITQQSGTPVDKPVDPTKEDYRFVGWTLNGDDVRWIKYDLTDNYYVSMPGGNVTFVAKWEMTAAGLTKLKEAKLAELQQYADSKKLPLPENEIEKATTEQGVLEAFDAGKAAVDAAVARIDAAKAAVSALSGKTGEALFNQLKAVDAALADLSAEEKAQVDLTAYNTAKAQLEALVSGAEADLEAANTAGATIAAAKIGAAVAALASLAALAFVLKRGIL